MKRYLVMLGMLVAVLIPSFTQAGKFPVDTDEIHVYSVWCRHDALYWGSVIGESLQVRVAIGFYYDGRMASPHAQPQVKILDSWYYFRAEPYKKEGSNQDHIKMVIISMPKKAHHTWKPQYHVTWTEFAVIHNTWMMQKDGQTYEDPKRRKAWNNKMNAIIRILRNKIPADIVP